MLAVQGIYDGISIIPLETIPKDKKYKVIITFVEEFDDLDEVRNIAAQTDAFDFWHDEKEDLYICI
jgi:hypothetical protein